MANPIKGEVAFEYEGKRYTFVFGTYAQAALQRRTGKPSAKFFARRMSEWGADDMLALFHAGLLRHQELSELEVADLMDGMGVAKYQAVISEGLTLAFPDAKTDKPADPTQPK